MLEPTSREVVQCNEDDGIITLNIKPDIKGHLKLKFQNDNAATDQEVDNQGEKLGLVVKSIEFLRLDQDFTLTG